MFLLLHDFWRNKVCVSGGKPAHIFNSGAGSETFEWGFRKMNYINILTANNSHVTLFKMEISLPKTRIQVITFSL